MVLPLVGLLGAAALSPHYRSYNENVRGRRLQRQADKYGVNLETAGPQQLADLGMRSGVLSLDDAIGVMEGQRDFDENVRQFNSSDQFRRSQQEFSEFKTGLELTQGMVNFAPGASDLGTGAFDAMALTNAHSGMESGNRYFDDNGQPILGPVIESGIHAGDRAIGKYQVMPNTLDMWSQDVFGRDVSPEEFAASPELQDQLYYEKFIKVAETEGIHNALSKWHSGLSYADAVQKGVSDRNMSTKNYVDGIVAQYQRNAAKNERGRVMADIEANDPDLHKMLNDPTTPQIRKQQEYEAYAQRMQVEAQRRQGVHGPTNERNAEIMEQNAPLVATAERISDVLQIMPEGLKGRRWGNWFSDNNNAVAAQRMSMMHSEIRQQWIDQMMQGREPSDAVRDELASAFPANPSMFTNGDRYRAFMTARQQELVNMQRRNLGLPQIDFDTQTSDGQEVIPDGNG